MQIQSQSLNNRLPNYDFQSQYVSRYVSGWGEWFKKSLGGQLGFHIRSDITFIIEYFSHEGGLKGSPNSVGMIEGRQVFSSGVLGGVLGVYEGMLGDAYKDDIYFKEIRMEILQQKQKKGGKIREEGEGVVPTTTSP